MHFRIKEVKYTTISGEKKYLFDDINLVHGANTSGKTILFSTIDTLLGKDELKYLKMDDNDLKQITQVEMTVEQENILHVIKYVINSAKIEQIWFNNNPVNKSDFNNIITKTFFGTNFEGDKNFGIRNFIIFNFHGETNVGASSVLLSKLKSNLYYSDLPLTFIYSLCSGNNKFTRYNEELKQLKLEKRNFKNRNIQIVKIAKLSKEKNIDNQNYTSINVEQAMKKLSLNELEKLEKELKIEAVLTDEIVFIKKICDLPNSEYFMGLEELFEESKNELSNIVNLRDQITKEISSIKQDFIEEENLKNEVLLYLLNNKNNEVEENEAQIIEINSKIKKIEGNIRKEKAKLNNILSSVQDTMLFYFNEAIKIFNAYENKVDESKFKLNMEDDFIRIEGKSFDPKLLTKENGKEKVKSFGSHSIWTLFQMSYIFALHEIARKNNGAMLEFICFDTYTQPFDMNRKNMIYEFTSVFKSRNVKYQIIFFDRDKPQNTEISIKLHDVSNGLLELKNKL